VRDWFGRLRGAPSGGGLSGALGAEEQERIERFRRNWNFYDGYHWEDIPQGDEIELTFNYCRAFVDKFVSFEWARSFSIATHKNLADAAIDAEGRTLFEYLEDVWEDNRQYALGMEIGQMKSVTGEAWLQVAYYAPGEIDDVYGEYPGGRVKIILHDSATIFAEYDPLDRDRLLSVRIAYEYDRAVPKSLFGGGERTEKTLFRQTWTAESVTTEDGDDVAEAENPYGAIPFVLIRNVGRSGGNEGMSDIDDVIPMNVEYNRKASNMSEIIDYHAAPVTIAYGVKIGNLEKGANKMWGGCPKDARIENLELRGDMASSMAYIQGLKKSMCEIGSIPETVLGGAQAVSNTSGVALQYVNGPLIQRTMAKRMYSTDGIEGVNRLILLISVREGLIYPPERIGARPREFYWTEVTMPDNLPKDELIELQKIQQEMQLGMESRAGAMARMGRENVEDKIARIDEDMAKSPQLYGIDPAQINSGILNGQTPAELARVEMTGRNGGEVI
jgi:hypothetical protein